MRSVTTVAAGMLLAGTMAPQALANQINTGGETGAYHASFCPQVETQLKKAKFDYTCTTSEGSRENIQRVIADPTQVGFSQLDVFALEGATYGGEDLFKVMRSDLGRECLFLVSRNPEFTSFGDVASYADQIRFILPPAKSGVTGTFEFLQQIDPDGLGRARNITYAESADEAIDLALAADDTVTLVVQFPDPKNTRFKTIHEQSGNIIPVIDRNILRQQIGEEKIYYAQETEVKNATWIASGESLVTACTPTVLFTGSPDKLGDEKARQDQKDLIATLRGLAVEELQPKVGFLAKLWKQSKELSAKGVEQMVVMSEQAREAAGPMIDKAKEMGTKALEQAGEITEQAKKKAEELLKGSGGESTSP